MRKAFTLHFMINLIFSATIEAWPHGPVIPALYQEYKKYGSGAIPSPSEMDFSIYDEQTRDLLDEIYVVFGQFSAWKLRNMTHAEPPWRDAFNCGDDIISHKSMKEYFQTRLN